MTTLPQDHIRALDQLRNRLSQLSLSVSSLRTELERSEPLPSWPSLQSTAQILGYNLQQVAETMSAHRQLLSSLHAYPLPNFPGHTHEGLAQQLLRKKLDPRAEDWIEEYSDPAKNPGQDHSSENGDSDGHLATKDLKELWSWAGPTSNEMLRKFVEDGAFDDDYTIAEREEGVDKVITGLRRKLDDDDDDDDDDEEETQERDTMDIDSHAKGVSTDHEHGFDLTKSAVPLDSMLSFLTTGATFKVVR